jgi:hypothetical protein
MRRTVPLLALALFSSLAAPGAAAEPEPGLAREVRLSPDEYRNESQKIIDRVALAAASVREKLMVARRERDVVKTLCLSDKLTQLDVALRSLRERREALLAAADQERAAHDFTIMGVLRQRADHVLAEANQCIGQPELVVHDKAVNTSIVPNILPDDAMNLKFPTEGVIIDPPTCSSCVK